MPQTTNSDGARAFKMIWIIFCIVQTSERAKKRSSTRSCKTGFLPIKHHLKYLMPEATIPTQPQEPNQISTSVLTDHVPTVPNPVQEPPEIITATPVQAPTQVTAPQASSTMETSSSISLPSLLLQFWHHLPQSSGCHQLESVNAPNLSNL